MKREIACLIIGGLTLTGCCSTQSGETVCEGAALGALVGAGIGGAAGGGRGAIIGAAVGTAAGAGAGAYVANQKQKYATIEQRITEERRIAAQATATARSQTEDSKAQLAVVNAQLRRLNQQQVDRATARDRATTMLASLEQQRTELDGNKSKLEARIKDQKEFIDETEREIGANDPQKAAQLAEWRAEIPAMNNALAAMTAQLSDISVMEARVERVRTL